MRTAFGPYNATVLSVTDGDTIRVRIDLGFRTQVDQAIRLKDVDAPELFRGDDDERARGRAARDFVKELLPAGDRVIIQTDKDKMSFNRYVATVQLADGRDLGATLVKAGHAAWV